MKRISKEKQRLVYKNTYKEALEWAEQYEVSLSEKHWNPNRPADRERYFCSQHLDWIMADIAQAQLESCEEEATAEKKKEVGEIFREIARLIKSYRIFTVLGPFKETQKAKVKRRKSELPWIDTVKIQILWKALERGKLPKGETDG